MIRAKFSPKAVCDESRVRLDKPAEPPPPKIKITCRKGRHAVVTTGRKLTNEQIRTFLVGFP
jgi:hypothetical protein